MEKEIQTEKKIKQDKLYQYAKEVITAQLECKAKSLLWFYAYTFNWTEGRPSFYPQDKICAYVGMSPKTYQKVRKYLEELGWIKVLKRGYTNPPLVWVKIGIDDVKYKENSYSAGHPGLQGAEPEGWDPFQHKGFDPLSPENKFVVPL